MKLRNYQQALYNEIIEAWKSGVKNVLATLGTGGGKTVLFSKVLELFISNGKYVCAMAHRKELLMQMSMSLAANGIKHQIIGDPKLIKLAVFLQMTKHKKCFVDTNARCIVVGVDTIIRRTKTLKHILDKVALWVMDEAHHLLKDNKWGRAVKSMPNAVGLGVTATAGRGDGAGLGRGTKQSPNDGVIDILIEGPDAGELIRDGWLTNYEVILPEVKLKLAHVAISKVTGDYVDKQLRDALDKSEIVGDVVGAYKEHIPGMLTAVFVTHTAIGMKIVEQFNSEGVAAEFIGWQTPPDVRVEMLRRFANREVLVLINVDLFGEGFDLPALDAVIFARPTASLNLYIQQCGRPLRLLLNDKPKETREGRLLQIAQSKKPVAWIVDLVGNYLTHLPPDKKRVWSLSRVKRRATSILGEVPESPCDMCLRPFPKNKRICPREECGHEREVLERGYAEMVEGDLARLDDETRKLLLGDVKVIDQPMHEYEAHLHARNVPELGIARMKRLHKEKQDAQAILREIVQLWANVRGLNENNKSELYQEFYHKFGMDVLTAQTLVTKDAKIFSDKITVDIGKEFLNGYGRMG